MAGTGVDEISVHQATAHRDQDLLGDELLREGVASLSSALWDQRAHLHDLAHRAKVAQLVMAGDDRRWIDRATDELDTAVRRLRSDDHVPARLLGAIARHRGLPTETTLRDLAASLPEPWATNLIEHAAGLSESLARLTAIERENRHLAISGLGNIRAMLAVLAPERDRSVRYDAEGRPVSGGEAHVDRVM